MPRAKIPLFKIVEKGGKRFAQFARKRMRLMDRPPVYYRTSNLKAGSLSYEEKIKTFREFRKIAKQRIRRLKKAGFDQAKLVKETLYHIDDKKVTEMEENTLDEALHALAVFIENPNSIESEMRKNVLTRVETLQRKHFDVSRENIFQFADFMEELREQEAVKWLDSAQVAKAWKEFSKKDRDPEEVNKKFNEWVDDQIEEKRQHYFRVLEDQTGYYTRSAKAEASDYIKDTNKWREDVREKYRSKYI